MEEIITLSEQCMQVGYKVPKTLFEALCVCYYG